MMRAGRLPWGSLRAFGVTKWQARHHRGHLGRPALVYFVGPEYQRRRAEGQRLARWRWRPGQSGGGSRKGFPDKRPRRPPSGIKAARDDERAERRAQWEALHGPLRG